MIIDRIEEQERYYPLHPDMELAFAFLAEAPDLESGRYELENGLFATVSEGETRPIGEAKIESHKKYIDLQYCISGGERMSWAHVQELNMVEPDEEHDNYFYEGKYYQVLHHVPQRRSQAGLPQRVPQAFPQGGREEPGRAGSVKQRKHKPQSCGFSFCPGKGRQETGIQNAKCTIR